MTDRVLSAEPGTELSGALLQLLPVTGAVEVMVVWGRNSGPD